MSRWLAVIILVGGLALTLSAGQGNGKGQGNSKGKGNPHAQKFDDERGRGHDRDDDARWERRGDYEYRVYEVGGRPPGWSEGRKVGWRECDMPPGLAKKYGCSMYVYEGRRYYYYHDDVGRIIVRRPTIAIHVDIVR